MSHRTVGQLQWLAVALAAVTLASSTAIGQAKPLIFRMPDGHPNLQGTWLNFDSTPFEAPLVAPPPGGRGGAVGGGLFGDRGPIVPRRRSMVVDPADGRVPVLAWAEQKRDENSARLNDSWEYSTPWERCITRGVPGSIFPALYNNAYQILQTPQNVAIVYEMIHEARIVQVDGSAHLPQHIRLWNGDSRGRWEGDTLVIDVANYNDKGTITATNAAGRIRGIPQSSELHVVERFRPVDGNTIEYEVTIDDLRVYVRPWKVAMPLTRDDTYQMYEYACHEGNYRPMEATIRGGRPEERK